MPVWIMRPLTDAGWSSWQLVGLITRRSQVQVLPPQPENLWLRLIEVLNLNRESGFGGINDAVLDEVEERVHNLSSVLQTGLLGWRSEADL